MQDTMAPPEGVLIFFRYGEGNIVSCDEGRLSRPPIATKRLWSITAGIELG